MKNCTWWADYFNGKIVGVSHRLLNWYGLTSEVTRAHRCSFYFFVKSTVFTILSKRNYANHFVSCESLIAKPYKSSRAVYTNLPDFSNKM